MIDSGTPPFPPLTRGDQSIARSIAFCVFCRQFWTPIFAALSAAIIGPVLEGVREGGENRHFRDPSKIGRFRGGLGEGVHFHAETSRSALRCLLDALVAFFRGASNFWRILRSRTPNLPLFAPRKPPPPRRSKLGVKIEGKTGVKTGVKLGGRF